MALAGPGDEVAYPDPGFPTYEAAIKLVGATPVPVALDEDRDFDLDLASLDAALGPRTRVIILNSPSNPTGGVLSAETLERVAAAARRLDCWVLSDEIYMQLTYDGDTPSIVSLPGMMERTILADGFSKTYAMTGWRLGFGVMPEPLAEKLGLLLTHSVGCTATFTQYAGLEAIVGPQDDVDRVREEFRARRDLIVSGLNAIPGVRCPLPRGAFYAFPNVESFGTPARQISEYLLDEAGVAVLSGTDFGPRGEGHLRLSYANSRENIQRALNRIAEALARLG
jgi:aspartate/methionine/tyrosine aminotransferase